MRSRPKFSQPQPDGRAGARAAGKSSLRSNDTRDGMDTTADYPVTTMTPFYHTSHGKPHRLFCELVMPLARASHPLPEKTAFVFTEEDILASALARIDKKCPHLYQDKGKFMSAVEAIVYGGSC